MSTHQPYNSLCKLLETFEEKSSCMKKIGVSNDACSGAVFVMYIADMAEPENKPQRMQDSPDQFSKAFISGIKTYIKNINKTIDNKILQNIKNLTLKEPYAIAYMIGHKKSPYVKGIISVTYDALSKGITLKDIGQSVKTATKKFDQSVPKYNEYWSTYRSLEKLL